MPDGLGAPLSEPLFQRLALIGMGLIGSSLARVCRRKGLAREIIAADISAAVRAKVVRNSRSPIEVVETAAAAVAGADLVILCAPPGAMGTIARDIAPYLEPGAILSDVGSVKASIIKAVAPHLPATVHFVPAHPVAGTEQSGPRGRVFDAFSQSLEHTDAARREPTPRPSRALAAFWTGAGANVEIMQAAHHDLVLAITSHVPHLIAYNIVGTAADLEEVTQSEVIKFSAGRVS